MDEVNKILTYNPELKVPKIKLDSTEVKIPATISFERARGEECRAELGSFKGREMFSIRCWYRDEQDTLKPGKNGINLPIEEKDDFLGLVVALFPDDIALLKPKGE